MSNQGKRRPSGKKSGVEATGAAETTPNRSGTEATPQHKHGNPGATHEAGDNQVQGASHQGSSLGKRNSG